MICTLCFLFTRVTDNTSLIFFLVGTDGFNCTGDFHLQGGLPHQRSMCCNRLSKCRKTSTFWWAGGGGGVVALIHLKPKNKLHVTCHIMNKVSCTIYLKKTQCKAFIYVQYIWTMWCTSIKTTCIGYLV